jgi:probable rRNA maturation factor
MVNVIISSDSRYPVSKLAIQSTVNELVQRYKIQGRVEIGVNIVGARKIHEINRKYRGIDAPTDILTFALEDAIPQSLQHIPRVGFVASPDKVLRLGDIILSYPQVVEDASLEGVSVDEEVRTLLEHGVKHLLGIHHD